MKMFKAMLSLVFAAGLVSSITAQDEIKEEVKATGLKALCNSALQLPGQASKSAQTVCVKLKRLSARRLADWGNMTKMEKATFLPKYVYAMLLSNKFAVGGSLVAVGTAYALYQYLNQEEEAKPANKLARK